ncbi:Alpha/Beta hydrolase protein [Bipolaris maydis]|nr:Alpha/Beta hydrolase protein [Bipolaris maydis]
MIHVRGNVYRPKSEGRYPVLVTYGPYGKDILYSSFHPKSFAEVNPAQKSIHSAWEVLDPRYWTANGYVVLRVDERGCGQSHGMLESMSRSTSDGFVDVIEWAAEQSWSSGKIGLLGISYYAGSQWRVAARRPKGLAAIVPWEGMSDYYRDRVRHGGILSNTFIEELISCRRSKPEDTAANSYRDDEYFKSKDFNLADIEVPLLSIANWGGILLHLRGNIQGYVQAGSEFKYLRCITGRHDLPFYYGEEVAVQRSFLDAVLKGEDLEGWTLPPVDMCLRVGNSGVNVPEKERKAFPRRKESHWPLANTQYKKFFLGKENTLSTTDPTGKGMVQYDALSGEVNFRTAPCEEEAEITSHPLAHLVASVSSMDGASPCNMDIFLTLRHYDSQGNEVFYTGTTGEPVPVVKGWLRLSLRRVDDSHPAHREYLPHRNYFSSNVQKVIPGELYPVDVEIWPTNGVIGKGHTLDLQIAGRDTQGGGMFEHNHPEDRPESVLKAWNNIHFGPGQQSFLVLPIIPSTDIN